MRLSACFKLCLVAIIDPEILGGLGGQTAPLLLRGDLATNLHTLYATSIANVPVTALLSEGRSKQVFWAQ